jgi:glutamate dehydrogenase/leucine dehydrogenase
MSPSLARALVRPSRSAEAVVWRRYGEYLRRPPLLSIEWADTETPARGWLIVNSLRGGAAGGGTRMRAGLSRREVVYLAKTMELKFAFSGPPIGGAKSGIDFDPTDPRREGVLRRWFQAVAPQLRQYYGTGGDLNVDEMLDVIPCCAEAGLLHPQEGVVRGHLRPDAVALPTVFSALDEGVKAPVHDGFGVEGLALPVADLVTGYGLAQSIIRLYESQARPIRGARVVLEGFGAVGGPCALYLARAGALVVGISDREKTLLARDGLDAAAVESLVRHREEKCLPRDTPGCRYGDRLALSEVEAEVFVSAACSESLDEASLERLARQGVRTIACGANQTFREAKLGATRVQRLADQRFTVLPDVVANCGMARAFSYLMQHPAAPDTGSLFRAVDRTITDAVREITERSGQRPSGLLAATLGFALDRVGAV